MTLQRFDSDVVARVVQLGQLRQGVLHPTQQVDDVAGRSSSPDGRQQRHGLGGVAAQLLGVGQPHALDAQRLFLVRLAGAAARDLLGLELQHLDALAP
jgi:hypothetical protein